MKTKVVTDKAPAAIGAYSQGIVAGGTLYVSGQIALDPATGQLVEGIEAQATRAMENVKAIVEAAGYTLDDVVKTTILLDDINNFGAVNEVYSKYFQGDCPARACFAVKDIPKGSMVEIEAIAVK